MKKTAVIFALALMCVSCAPNGFHEYYRGLDRASAMLRPGMSVCETPLVDTMPNLNLHDLELKMYESGYGLLGSAAWAGTARETDADALDQGKEIGACLVLWSADFSHVESGVSAVPVYVPGPTVASYRKAYYNGRPYYYRSFYTYPGYTYYDSVPYSVRVFNYTGAFFARLRPEPLGVRTTEPPEDYMKKFDTRSGGLVTALRKDGSAFRANIFEGDIIISVNGRPFASDEALAATVRPGEKAEVKIYRDGKVLSKDIIMY